MAEIPKKYKSQEIEKKWQDYWYKNEIYKWDSSESRDNNFVIDTPPPTVSGVLHMGHVFSYTQADFIARYQRMKGKTVYYPMGFDDNGLPTERLVEKIKKIRGNNMPREEFIEICRSVVKNAEEDFRDLFKSVALSIDWDEEYQTISDQTRQISQLSFLDLYHKGLIYRKNEATFWDVSDRTALAQADLEDKEVSSYANHIIFSIDGFKDKIEVMTTRPEMLLGCVAVLYHPDDKRYTKYKGKYAISPLFGVKVPMIADSDVKMDKGTGLVMCCTFGDEQDIIWWKRHDFPTRVILSRAGKIDVAYLRLDEKLTAIKFPHSQSELELESLSKDNVFDLNETYKNIEKIHGRTVHDAREIIIKLLEQDKLLVSREEITHNVKCGERSGTLIEILVTPQWFIKIIDKKQELIEKADQCKWHPHYMKARIEHWIEGLKWDWCISRQRFFGVPFPLWYIYEKDENHDYPILETKEVRVASKEDLPIDPLFSIPKGFNLTKKLDSGDFIAELKGREYYIRPEQDIMDTWATSSISPQISSGAINEEYAINYEKHQKLFPADLRPQAHEIIRTWAFYTICKSHLHENTIPWKHLMVSGWCLASDKTKMSKSKGNVVTPVNLINDKGTDVVRFWTSTSHLGADTAYSETVLTVGKKLINKLWNASKFANLQISNIGKLSDSVKQAVEQNIISYTSDLWLLSRLKKVIENCEKDFARYEYAKVRYSIEDFFWNDFCDNYLELVKARSYGDHYILEEFKSDITKEEIEKGQLSAVHTIYHTLNTILKLFAPFLPHITEELYSLIFEKEFKKMKSIHARGNWPEVSNFIIDDNALSEGKYALQIIDLIRKEKSDKQVSVKAEIKKLEIFLNKEISLSDNLIFDIALISNAKKAVIINDNKQDLKVQFQLAA